MPKNLPNSNPLLLKLGFSIDNKSRPHKRLGMHRRNGSEALSGLYLHQRLPSGEVRDWLSVIRFDFRDLLYSGVWGTVLAREIM
jgi:hypothetical protein